MLEKFDRGQDLKKKKFKNKRYINISQTRHFSLSLMSAFTKTAVHLWEERPLILGLLDAVSHQPFHGLGAVLIELAKIWGQTASSHHKYNLRGGYEHKSV